jgi:hypothetical protein
MIRSFEREPGLSGGQVHIQKEEGVGNTHQQRLGLYPLQLYSSHRPEYVLELIITSHEEPAKEVRGLQ